MRLLLLGVILLAGCVTPDVTISRRIQDDTPRPVKIAAGPVGCNPFNTGCFSCAGEYVCGGETIKIMEPGR